MVNMQVLNTAIPGALNASDHQTAVPTGLKKNRRRHKNRELTRADFNVTFELIIWTF
jgi:hypothetical protein